MIRPERIGHVVIKVRDLERSARFYSEVMGLQIMKMEPEFKMGFFASNGRDHHEIAAMEVGPDAPLPPAHAIGLFSPARRGASARRLRRSQGARRQDHHGNQSRRDEERLFPRPGWQSTRGLLRRSARRGREVPRPLRGDGKARLREGRARLHGSHSGAVEMTGVSAAR